MKKLLHTLSVLLIIAMATSSIAHAQESLTVVPNPDAGRGWQGGYAEYNGNLYFTYLELSGQQTLGEYNGDTVTLIPNPAGAEMVAPLIVVNDTLYLEYYVRAAGAYELASYDGTTITIITNPDNTQNPFVEVIDYNNKLLFQYQTNTNAELAEWAGGKWKIFGLPSGGFTFNSPFVLYKNNVYMGFETSPPGNVRQLLKFNDTAATLVANPDAATAFSPYGGGFQGNIILFGNDLYFRYVNINSATQLAQYDGDTVRLITNPTGGIGYVLASLAQAVIYDSAMYIPYCAYPNISDGIQIGKFDGKTLTLIPNPDAGQGYQGAPIVYDSSLYFQYQDASGIYRLGKYNDTTITLLANPQAAPSGYANYSASGGDITPPIIYGRASQVLYVNDAKLYIQYSNVSKINQLGQYTSGADSIQLIPNPDTAVAVSTGYYGSPFVYNNLLYICYAAADYTFHFAYLNILSDLPVSLLNFTAQQKGDAGNLLQWQTATEDNSSYFNIQRSTTGRNFVNVGKVAAAGNSNALLNYSYVDPINDADYAPAIYYRLQEVDKDGKSTFSKVAIIRIDGNGGFSITPNPVSGDIVLTSAVNAAAAELTLHDMGGKTLYNAKTGLTAGGKVYIPATALANGMYILTITVNNISYELKAIKGAQ